MKKDFIKWHNKKSKIDTLEKRPFFHEREIWFLSLGVNVGFEQDGVGVDFMRPVLIMKKFNNEIFWGIPLTKKTKNNKKSDKYYFRFSFTVGVDSFAILSQIKLTDARRLNYKIGQISEKDFSSLTKKFKGLIP